MAKLGGNAEVHGFRPILGTAVDYNFKGGTLYESTISRLKG